MTEALGRLPEAYALGLRLRDAGAPNEAIAEWLVVSVRTVEGHLYRAGAKLGTSDRTQFAALLYGQ